MSQRIAFSGARSPRALLQRLGATSVAGKPLTWYLSGWRGGLVLLVLLVLLPQFLGTNGAFTGLIFGNNEALVLTAVQMCIFVILALGLNIVVGYAGLLDLGYVAFYAIGAYFVSIFTYGFILGSDGKVHQITTYSFWILLPIAAIVASFFGVLLGAPTLRLRGDYLAIVTLGFGEIVPIVFNNVPWFYKQSGLTPTPPADLGPYTLGPLSLGPFSFSDPLDHIPFYYLTIIIAAIAVLFVRSLRDSKLGRAWIAIREDETAAASSGINLVRTKLLAFGLGALIGGVGGALFAGYSSHVDTSTLNFNFSIEVLVMIVLGGIGSIPGVIVGAALLSFLDRYFLGQINQTVHGYAIVSSPNGLLHFINGFDFNTAKYLIFGVVLLLMILLRPQGIISDVRRRRELQGIGASLEGASAVGLLEREEAGALEEAPEMEDVTAFAGPGSDVQGREE